jgi:hypothetical protein
MIHIAKGRYVSHDMFLYAEGLSETAIDDILSLLDEPSEPWRPQAEERYWTVDGDGKVYEALWQEDATDQARASFGNCFPSRSEAEQACDHLKAVLAAWRQTHGTSHHR